MNEPTQLPGFREAFYRRERRSIPLVRQFARQALTDWAYGPRTDDVLLCVSELATNALVHGVPPGRGFRIHLCHERAAGVLRVEIHDSGDGEVRATPGSAPDAESGRGLLLVEALADKWGVGERDPGKTVWCEFAASASKFVELGSGAHHLPQMEVFRMSDMNQRYDVVVVGGGAAGLSGALTLSRARRSVLVIDAGSPRNAPASHVHNYLGREGTPPSRLQAIGREEAMGYGAEIVEGEVVAAEKLTDGFRVVREDGTAVEARRLLVTTGLIDELPPVRGLAERWGREVLHCPYCHGWEVRSRPIGILAVSPMAVHQALLWRQWSADVTLFLHTAPEPSDEEHEQLAARGIAVVDGEVAAMEVTDDRLTGVRLVGGRVIAREAVVVQPRFTARSGILETLGLSATDQLMGGHVVGSYIAADPSGATEVPGVWVAGNVANLTEQVIGAAAAGLKAAGAINADLVADDTRRAVEARRAPFSAEAERQVSERVLGERRHGLQEMR